MIRLISEVNGRRYLPNHDNQLPLSILRPRGATKANPSRSESLPPRCCSAPIGRFYHMTTKYGNPIYRLHGSSRKSDEPYNLGYKCH